MSTETETSTNPVVEDEEPAFMSLASQYKLSVDMEIGMVLPEASIEQEYQAYITAPLSPKTNILRFWEVSSVHL
jgi:hypothetical protein